MTPGWKCGQSKPIMNNIVEIRRKTFKKIVDLKQAQKSKIQNIKQKMKQLERQNLSMSGFAKLTIKSIKMIQTQRRANIILIKSEFEELEKISNQLTFLETDYLKIVSK